MPELPEVETTRRGIARHVKNRVIARVAVRQRRLRYPLPPRFESMLTGRRITGVTRRAKYLLLGCDAGALIVHLGMSGSLRVVSATVAPAAHDHIDLVFDNGRCLRYRDPRRFGAMVWTPEDPEHHPLLAQLGPEPLSNDFDGEHLFNASRQRRIPVKALIMDNHVVVGVGNIYANEALFAAGILPQRQAGKISRARYLALAGAIKAVLADAVKAGGTTLRDFTDAQGKPGYFRHALRVYARGGESCLVCQTLLKQLVIGQRASYYCPCCQT